MMKLLVTASRRPSFCRLGVVSIALCLTQASPVAADLEIHEVTAQIEQDPANAVLYLKRGDLYRAERDWEAALRDFDRAAFIDPNLTVVNFRRGVTLLEANMPGPAKIAFDNFLAREPDHAAAFAARARALVRLGDRVAAAADFTRAIERLRKPGPEYYLERAEALAGEGDAGIDEALRGLDEGLQKLGPVVTLQLLAIDLELKKFRYDAALGRVDKIAAAAARKETWLARRGEILERAGRPAEAHQALTKALAAIESLPDHRRGVKATKELEARLRVALARLTALSGN